MKQIYLKYNGQEITNTTYVLQYTLNDKTEILYFEGMYSYAKALIYAYENNITGYITYCLSRSRIKIINGIPVKRGRKPQQKKVSPFSVIEIAPETMQPYL